MTKKLKIAFVVTLMLMVTTGSARAATIDFNQFNFFNNFDAIPVNAFDALGVTFDQPLFKYDGLEDLSDSGGAGVSAGTMTVDPFEGPLSGFFFGPVTSVDSISAWVGDEGRSGTDIDTITLQGFDAANNLVDSDSFTSLGGQRLSISGPGIVRFVFTASDNINPNGSFSLDDFTFNPELQQPPPPPTGVPEPGSLLLLATGLVGIVGSRRKRA